MARTGQHPWLRAGLKISPTRKGYCSNTNGERRYRCEDNNVAFTNVQPYYYRVRQVEPCRHLGLSSQALILSILAHCAIPKQQQKQILLLLLTTCLRGVTSCQMTNVCCGKRPCAFWSSSRTRNYPALIFLSFT